MNDISIHRSLCVNPSDCVQILLVEDDPLDLQLALRALKKAAFGALIQVARDGEETLELLFSPEGKPALQPGLILLDLKLPKIDGFEVLQRIRSDPRTRMIPVVIVSSSTQPNDMTRSYQLGANSYIVKAVCFEQFALAIKGLAKLLDPASL